MAASLTPRCPALLQEFRLIGGSGSKLFCLIPCFARHWHRAGLGAVHSGHIARAIPPISQPLGRLVKEWQCYTRLDLSPRLFMEENKSANNQWRPVQIQTILVPTDLRLESMVAFQYALTLAHLRRFENLGCCR